MDEAIGIGFFQFDNLIRNRVPFAFFNYNCDFSSIYSGQEATHVQRYSLSVENPIESIKAINYRNIDPVLFICRDGSVSKDKANDLCKHGFINCYYVEGGFSQLLKSYQEQNL